LLRAVTPADYEYLKSVHHSALREHVTKIWGWDEEAQDNFFKEDFESGQIRLIEINNEAIGYLQIDEGPKLVSIVNILILREFQGRGYGTQILQSILAEASTSGKAVRLGVFKINTRARKLYESLGFKVCDETDTHYRMKI
jgi:ribosomal protein S18 acetylase RimI-like enzyme